MITELILLEMAFASKSETWSIEVMISSNKECLCNKLIWSHQNWARYDYDIHGFDKQKL